MSELSKSDAELVYKYLNSRVRADIEAEAYDKALEAFAQTDDLEAAAEDPVDAFVWNDVTDFGFEDSGRGDELVPYVYTEEADSEVYAVAREFGWTVVEYIREEIRRLQETTMFSPREFVALVVGAEWDEQNAASIMDISVGNFRGKKGSIAEKLETAEATQNVADRLRE